MWRPRKRTDGEPSHGVELGPTATLPEGFGRYLVARHGVGERWQGAARSDDTSSTRPPRQQSAWGDTPTRVIPVYDEPGGPKRMLVEDNVIDAVEIPMPLFNWADQGSPTVLRVINGEPGHDWVQVQAPTRPHNQSVWVRTSDFDWAQTSMRIEINLDLPGTLTLYDGDDLLLDTTIVQGRASRRTPTHVTYLQSGALTSVNRTSVAYGHAMLRMASFSEELGTFGGGGSPENFLHGTNHPELMGSQVSSGEIRLADQELMALIDLAHPGVPIIIYGGPNGGPNRQSVLNQMMAPAKTTRLDLNAAGSTATSRSHPQLWITCDEPTRVCLNPEPSQPPVFRYAVAKDLDSEFQIPVFDEPGAWDQPRTLIDVNEIDGIEQPEPLFAVGVFGEPLVLRVLAELDGWLKVQVPVRPNQSHTWVRASEFEVFATDVFVEIALAASPMSDAGELLVYRGPDLVLRQPTASGRESRPTPTGTGWIWAIIDGERLGPAYGPWLAPVGLMSEALGTFGGGGQPSISIHGTNQAETIGQQLSSGGFRISDAGLNEIVALEGILGAPVFIHDSIPYLTYDEALLLAAPTTPARTAPFDVHAEPLIDVFT